MKFSGVITAIVSPFHNDKIDEKSFKQLLKQQWDAGIRSIVINGTTGESPTLEWDEVIQLFQMTKKDYPQMQIIIGAGGNNTKKVVALAKKAEALGADGILSVVPYYNKPTQEGMFQHFRAIAQSVKTPIILYNVPGRTVASMDVSTVVRLSEIPNIVAIKEAAGKPEVIKEILTKTSDFNVLSGDDGTYLDAALLGCHGVISVISHLIPQKFIEWTRRAYEGDQKVLIEFSTYMNLCNAIFKEPNPVPVKECLKHLEVIDFAEVRLPLTECSESLSQSLKSIMSNLGVS